MKPERWRRIQEILAEAIERPPGGRDAFVEDACGPDLELKREVLELLQATEGDPDFLETPVVRLAESVPADLPPPERVGAYRVERRLGRGGMGDVYLAEREGADFQQWVALKLVRPGMDTADVLRRFRSERRILASLRHPNIAGLIDGGITQDQRPFFVMEYVEGLPLDRYCSEQGLGIRERLGLMRSVCAAVQHAHQNLVVHRDLKPSNVLVTAQGVPKLLDFGIAKLLDDPASDHTEAEHRLLTPHYAAPEQLLGEPATTATDVYALGVILYELLTDRRPFEGLTDTTDRMQAVLNTTPRRPSQVAEPGSRALAGDLDVIVLRALARDPTRRYPSVQSLADDLERHLSGFPVRARPDTLSYRTAKFIGRNRLLVGSAVLVFLVLAGSTAVSRRQARQIAQVAERLRSERDKALEVRSFLLEMFGTTGATQVTADAATIGDLMDLRAASLGQEFAAEPETLAEMQDVLAEGYRQLGRLASADSMARASLATREALMGSDHPDIAASLNTLGLILHQRGEDADAEPLLQRAVRLRSQAVSDRPDELARALNDLGLVLEARSDPDSAARLYTRSLDIRRADDPVPGRGAAVTMSNLAALHYRQGRYEEAVELASQAVEVLRAVAGADHRRTLVAQSNLAVMRSVAGDLEGATVEYRDLLERRLRVLGPDHPDVAYSQESLGAALVGAGDLEGAELHYREALRIRSETLGPRHQQTLEVARRLERIRDARH